MTKSNQRGPYHIDSSTPVYENPWISVREDRVTHENGKAGLFGVVELKPGSTVLAMDDEQHVHLVKEYKYGLGDVSIELMSGGIDQGETPLDCAQRELQEELGLVAARWTSLGLIHPFTTVMDSPNHMFVAQELTDVPDAPDDWEVIESFKVPLPDAVAMVDRGEITHAASCMCLLLAERMFGR